MGTLQQISALMVWEMWGLRFMNALLAEENMRVVQYTQTHFRFRSRSDSIRLRVKTTRLRSSVLDMYGGKIWGPRFCSGERRLARWRRRTRR